MHQPLPLIVIGAGLAGWTTIREFRKLDSATPVVLVTADSGDFYAKPSLSNAFAQGKLPAQLISTPAAKMAETQNVTLMPHTQVLSIDTANKTLTTGTGTLGWRDLVLATGAQPIRVPLQGDAAQQVMSVNSLDDFTRFHALLQASAPGGAKPHVVIMGAGLIGCEFANDLAQAGFAVSVVDPATRALAALVPDAASAVLQQALESLGVRFYFGTTVASVHFSAVHTPERPALSVRLANGEQLSCLGVLSAVGLRPDTTLAQTAGLQVDRGVVVDAHLQTSAAHVYALGDGAQYASAASALSAHGCTLPYVMPIMTAARALAGNLAGQPTRLVFSLMPVSVKTPALPLVVAAPSPGTSGKWHAQAIDAPAATVGSPGGLWQWLDDAGLQRGFVLAGAQTSQRMAQSKLVTL